MKKNNKIIIVDDDEDLLRILVFYFEGKGFEVHTIATGKEAVKFLLNEKNMKEVCLLVLDRMLPDMEGLDILTRFTEKYHHQVPVLILSVLGSDKDIIEGLKKGAVDYVKKPFNHDVLMQKALSLIARGHHV